jgi:hypothetical protein
LPSDYWLENSRGQERKMNIVAKEFLNDTDVEILKGLIFKDLESVCITTGKPINGNEGKQIWFRIEAKHPYIKANLLINEYKGKFDLCECEECTRFPDDVGQYYAVFLALKFIKERLPLIPITIRVDSASFLFDSEDGFHWPERTSCPKQNQFMKELFELLWELGISGTSAKHVFKNN